MYIMIEIQLDLDMYLHSDLNYIQNYLNYLIDENIINTQIEYINQNHQNNAKKKWKYHRNYDDIHEYHLVLD